MNSFSVQMRQGSVNRCFVVVETSGQLPRIVKTFAAAQEAETYVHSLTMTKPEKSGSTTRKEKS